MDICIGGIDLHYIVEGNGKDVLLLHGWGGSIDSFLPVTKELSKNYRVTVVDFPGFGNTAPPATPWSVTEYMQLIKEFIIQTNIQGCDIVCHSFGGRVTILLASCHPDLVGKLVLVDAAGVKPKRTLKYHIKVKMFKLGKRIVNCKCCMKILGPIGKRLLAKTKSAGSKDYRALSDDMKKTFVKVVNQDLTSYLKNIKSSTLLIWGENDVDTPLYMAKIMEKEIPDAGLVVFEGASHFSYLDRFDRFMLVLNTFLGGNK